MTQKGFTLIELMIVVAIVGILSVIAMTSMYQNYTIRARVTEGLVMASSAQLAVSETTQSIGVLPNNQAATGYVTPAATNNVASIVIGAAGVITITYNAKASGGTLVLTPTLTVNGDITWTCTAGTLATKYLPANCR